MPPSTDAAAPERAGGALHRFDRVERGVHWANAVLFAALILTGLALYSSSVMALVGRRRLVEDIHLGAGLALPLPVLASLAGRYGRELRADLGRLNRWQDTDRAWIRSIGADRARRAAIRRSLWEGKFNAGQKLNTAFTGGSILVMLGTGVIMYWYHPWPLAWRTGATSTHDWLAIAIVVVLLGHISYALRDPDSMGSMLHGRIPRRWASTHAPAWLEELDGQREPTAPAPADEGSPPPPDEGRLPTPAVAPSPDGERLG